MKNTATAHFQSFDPTACGWRKSFGNPRSTRSAEDLDDVIPLLAKAEAASRDGFWVALMVSYDAAPAFDDALISRRDSGFPLAWMAVFDKPVESGQDPLPAEPFSLSGWEAHEGRSDYRRSIDSIRSYIERGDSYQVNYTFPLYSRFTGDPFGCFRAIGPAQGARYSAYLDIGPHQVLSFSPELFFERRGEMLITRPMKGTMPRGRWLGEDDERARALGASLKDRAENVMIVDLLRSDLGKVAAVGSVEVPELFAVERLKRVLQMTSTVTAIQRPGTTLVNVFRALFPCGSVTGAPKARSTELIAGLEHDARGIYTGAIGLLAPGGDAVFNVAIRTLVVEKESGTATFGVGGGITWDSTVEGEYDECFLKARFLTEPWPEFSLLETLALDDGVYFLLERHLSRVRESARYFQFRWDETNVSNALEALRQSRPSGRWRVRLVADSGGTCRVDAAALSAPTGAMLSARLASAPSDERDPLLYHKTTARSRYDDELARSQPCDDVIFWNSRGEITESTIANVVISSEGRLWTPPRTAGLLAGTLRDDMIAKGELLERTVLKAELMAAESFALINSVRGWRTAKMIE